MGNKLQATSAGKITSYAYDALNRLISSTPPGGTATTYTYDAVSNRLSVVAPTSTTNYTYDIANRMTAAGAAVQKSDHNGNLRSDGTLTYGYDALNRLTSVKGTGVSATYEYDGLGRRVQQLPAERDIAGLLRYSF